MKIEMGKQYRTRDGREVRIYAVDGGGAFPIHGSMKTVHGWGCTAWMDGGKARGDGVGHNDDLIEVRPKFRFERWANVYPGDLYALCPSRESADSNAGPDRIACIKVVIEGEEGDRLEGGDA